MVVSINVASQGAMRHYTHLSAEERDRIAEPHAEGKAVSDIAGDIGRDSSTLSRKLKRNGRHGLSWAYKVPEEGRRAPRKVQTAQEALETQRWPRR